MNRDELPAGANPGVTHFYDLLTGTWEPISGYCWIQRTKIGEALARLKPFREEFEECSELLPQLVYKFLESKRGTDPVASEVVEPHAAEPERQRALWLADVLGEARRMYDASERKLRDVRADRDELRDEVKELKGRR